MTWLISRSFIRCLHLRGAEMVNPPPPHWALEVKFINLLRSYGASKRLLQIQAQVFVHGFGHNDYINPKIIALCFQTGKIDHARKVFEHIPSPHASLWNAMFKGYCQSEMYRDVVVLFSYMKGMDIMPNCFTFPIVLKSCGKIGALVEGREVHCLLIKAGFKGNPFIGTSLIDMYSGGREIDSAFKAFSELLDRNVVAWTSMVNSYISCGDIASARRIFDLAPERDIVLWNTMVSGYIEKGDMLGARKLFDQMPNHDVMSWNTMLNGYMNTGNVDSAVKLFEEMPERNIFSWNGLIGGYSHNGHLSQVLESFQRMLVEASMAPNDATLVTVLSACTRLGALDLGKWIHTYSEENGYRGNVYVGNALMDMYAKCGIVENAVDVFMKMESKDLISWNTIINCLAVHSRGAEALSMFQQMKHANVKPDGITFLGILSACTHMGLVSDGFSYFQSMIDDYLIVPQIEHYGCMVDLLGRTGLLVQAVDFVSKMPIKADAVIWTALLGACKIYKNVEVAELALERLIEIEPKNPSNYVMLSNIYGDLGRWKDMARLKLAMKETGFKKQPGCSSIELDDGVVEFFSLDERHPDKDAIYGVLKDLFKLSRSHGHVPDLIELETGN
ncbi:hypothetical protein SAY86_026439 [Trapa natans]|uniref:Pentatricopeptide repeat-containing protein n=1 Tax=Trapa natans TaxID=22666 RepID=A0AAN7QEW2_TRANT|nr:hypothetical protein SAY86_026439 [Trapa natans]